MHTRVPHNTFGTRFSREHILREVNQHQIAFGPQSACLIVKVNGSAEQGIVRNPRSAIGGHKDRDTASTYGKCHSTELRKRIGIRHPYTRARIKASSIHLNDVFEPLCSPRLARSKPSFSDRS